MFIIFNILKPDVVEMLLVAAIGNIVESKRKRDLLTFGKKQQYFDPVKINY